MTEGKIIHRAGYVCILGRPNVGKSTLLNQILGVKLSITSPKPQTTRHRILGIRSEEDYQIVFLDTPGLMVPHYHLQEVMMKTIESAIADADVILFMVEANDTLATEDSEYLQRLRTEGKSLFIIINKIDQIDKQRLLPLMQTLTERFQPEEIIPISALTKDGLSILLAEIVKRLPASPPYYPAEMLTAYPERFFVAEIIREKIFYYFGEEIPYSTTVVIDEYREQEGRKDFIRAIIFTERESQKGILIGKGGSKLKKLGTDSRKEIEAFLGKRVHLKLFVKVREKWREKDGFLRGLGYGKE